MMSIFLERLSKSAVVASACIAVLFGAWLGAREWQPLLPLTVAALVVGAAAGRWLRTRAWIPVLACAYILPALFQLTRGFMLPAYWTPWIAALLGTVIGNLDYRGWAFPSRWKWPLAYWALAIALVWPAVIAREADFSWALMSRYNLANSGLGGSPPVIAVWILNVALTHLVGLLWLDAAFTRFLAGNPEERLRTFTRDVVWPLAVSILIGSAVAIYQGTVDINWLSGHQWPSYHRASGSLDDGNPFGFVAGLWAGVFLAVAAVSRRRAVRVTAILGACVASAGLWMTGSRMALLAALICFAFALWFAVTARKWSRRDLAVVGLSAIGLLAVLGFFVARSSTASPIARVRASLPDLSRADLHKFASFELWNRFGPYGTASVVMVRDFPLSGVGVGSFNHLFPDYAFVLVGKRTHMDNAQSWYRHQLAELGVLGSLGWLVWLPMFVVLLARTRGDANRRFAATMIKGALVAVGVVSAVSMPTQSLPVAFTVWVLVVWYLLLSTSAAERLSVPSPAPRAAAWAGVVWMLALTFVAATLYVGWRDLRPPYRAIRADWTYQVGFFPLEAAGLEPVFRWTEKHAVMVLPATGPWLKLTVRGGPPDISERPIRLEIRRHGKAIVAITRQDVSPITWYVQNTEAANRMMLEFDVSRAWRPSDYSASRDRRELGVMVDDFSFVNEPPSGAIVIR